MGGVEVAVLPRVSLDTVYRLAARGKPPGPKVVPVDSRMTWPSEKTRWRQRARRDMERMHEAMMEREERVLEMKQEVNDLLAQLGQERKYEHV